MESLIGILFVVWVTVIVAYGRSSGIFRSIRKHIRTGGISHAQKWSMDDWNYMDAPDTYGNRLLRRWMADALTEEEFIRHMNLILRNRRPPGGHK